MWIHNIGRNSVPVPFWAEGVDGDNLLAGAALLDTGVAEQPAVQLQQQPRPQPDPTALRTPLKVESHKKANYLHEIWTAK